MLVDAGWPVTLPHLAASQEGYAGDQAFSTGQLRAGLGKLAFSLGGSDGASASAGTGTGNPSMIIVVEGPSAAGKTTWIAAHRHGAAVIAEAQPGPAPHRGSDPASAAIHWAKVSASRWAAACQAEQRAEIAVCDTDPFKLHYVWCLWQTGHATARQWRAEMNANRQLFASGRLGIADLILVSIPEQAVLSARHHADTTRRRRNFDLHAQLAHPLRDWYRAVSALDPDRVRWHLPATGIPDLGMLQRRNPRTGTAIFDSLMDQLAAR